MRLLLAIALASLSVSACNRADSSAAKTSGPGDVAKTASLLLLPEDLLMLQATQRSSGPIITGSVQPSRRADLRAEVPAVVVQVLKDNGDAVRTGDLLMRLDDTALRDNLGSAEEAARASVQAYEQSERQVQRQKTLKQQGMISAQALEDAEVRRNASQSDLAAARARVVSARQQMQRTLVRAPFDGVVSERKASVGDTTQIGKELVKVIDPRSMRFEGLVSADRLHELAIGQPVVFHVNGHEPTELQGSVQRLDVSANATTRQLAVIVDFADAKTAPRVAGLFAEGRIHTGAATALMVPERVLVRAAGTSHVWRLNGQALSRVVVQVGARDARSGEYEVLAGLSAGDQLLRNPGGQLVDGQTVEFATPASASPASASPAASVTAVSAVK